MTEGNLHRRLTGSMRRGRTNALPLDEDIDENTPDVPPPAYGEQHDQLQFSQSGFAADAAVTADGRVNIHINEKNSRLSELLTPALKRQLRPDAQLPSGPLPPAYIPPSLGGLPGQTPPPRLNVVVQIVGSRGDVQPFVALGKVLRETYGHRVRLATHANFRSFVEENGLEFFNIGGDPAQLMAFMVKNPGLMPALDTLKSGEIKRRRQEIEEILMGCWRSCIEAGDGMGAAPPQHRRDEPVDERFVLPGDPRNRPFVADAIIANPPSFAHIHLAEKLGIPLHMMFTMPWTPTRAFPHPLADIVSTNADAAITNYVSYALVEMMTWQGLGDVINRFRESILDLDPISLLWAPGLLNRLRVPATYCWSPALTPKPTDWMPEITVAGFYFLNLESNYTPERDLAAFLAAGPPPVYIGFGSIVVDDPDALTQTIFGAIIKSGVRAIVSQGWGGLGGDAAGVPEGVFMLGNCPHDWLFKHVSAVVHHGGAGTTAAGIKAGLPTVVVPFFGDQVFWGSMVAKAGAGPPPIPYKKLTAENLALAIESALQPETQARARELGEKIKEEKGADVGGKTFHQFLNTDNMRCSLAPSRVAVWRVRRSKVRLSALAAAVLTKEGWLKYSDLKLYRPLEYNTDEQPWDPISAVLMALAGDVGALTMAIADFPRELFKGAQGKKDKVGNGSKDGPVKEETASLATSGSGQENASSSHQRADSHSDIARLKSKGVNSSVDSLSLQPSTLPLKAVPSSQPPSAGRDPQLPPNIGSSSTSSSSSANPLGFGMAIAAGKSIGRIAGATARTPANFTLGLARGFRNAPKLYNDDTVRPPEKVTGLASGLKIAGKEFGLGFYDGISGLVTQPWKGAEKEGAKGFVKGVGKGIGGMFLKSSAAICSLPAYTMQGVRTGVRNMFARSSINYIITSRVLQGEEDLNGSSAEERRDIMTRWHTVREDLKGFYLLKQRESEKARAAAIVAAANADANAAQAEGSGEGVGVAASDAGASSRLSWKALQTRPWDRLRSGSSSTLTPTTGTELEMSTVPPTTASSAPSELLFDNDEAMEQAIQQSVVQTSTGDKEEDAMVEAAVRASVTEMRRVAEQQQQQGWWQTQGWIADHKATPVYDEQASTGLTDEEWTNITDEEYQALIEEAVRQSLLQQQLEQAQYQWAAEGEGASIGFERVSIEHPAVPELPGDTCFPPLLPARGSEDADEDEEAQLRRAMEESERKYRNATEQLQRQRTEEEIVLEYVKRQSLAEEGFRRARDVGKGKGVSKPPQQRGQGQHNQRCSEEDDEDGDLRRALEESLRMSGGGGGGGSWGRDGGPSRSR
ncbi:hypothetical protein VTI74DRAFT_4507 [Chaetomium olivicolor]